MAQIFLSLGSNLGDRENFLEQTRKEIGNFCRIEKTSSLYETEPRGVEGHPWYLNQCMEVETELSPEEFFKKCQSIEKSFGRKQKGDLAPREVDIDILFYDNLMLESDNLLIPHPRLAQRRFVLVPLAEIAPNFIHPVFKKTVEDLLKECEDQGIVRALK